MTKQELLVKNEQLRAQLSAAQEVFTAPDTPKLTAAEEKLQAEVANHLQDKQKIIHQNEFLELVIESLAYPFYIIDASDYTLKIANSAAAVGTLSKNSKCYRIFHSKEQPCKAPECPCPLEEVRETGKPCVMEHFHRDRHGNVRIVEIHAHPIFDPDGKVTQIIECDIDITDRKKFEETLRASESRYRSLFQNMPIGISLVSLDGQVVQCNRTMSQLTGYSEAELRNMNIRELFQNSKEYEPLWKRLKKNGFVHDTEGKLIRKDGTSLYASLTVTRYTLDGSEVVLLSAIDVTPRKKVEAELKTTAQTLEEQQLALERKNIALTEVVEQIGIEKSKLKDDISTNINELVFPILEKLRLTEEPGEYLDLLEHHLREITGTFGIKISKLIPKLSSREIEISSMIQFGLTSKEIARLLNISDQTVEKHRQNIRKKVGISGRKINLFSFLQTDI